MEREDNKNVLDQYFKKTEKLENIIIGIDGNNGLRSKVKELEEFMEDLKPQIQDLVRSSRSLDAIKDNTKKIIIVLITTGIMAVGAKFVQIKNGNEANQTLNEIKTIQEHQK